MMSIQDLGSIGEFVSSIAVLITLIYLAIQIRQNTRQLQQQTNSTNLNIYTAIDESFSRFRMALGTDGEVAELWRRARLDYGSLNPEEQDQAYSLIHEYFVMYQNMYRRLSMTFGEKTAAETTVYVIRKEFEHPGLLDWWQKYHEKHFFPDFHMLAQGIVDERFAQQSEGASDDA